MALAQQTPRNLDLSNQANMSLKWQRSNGMTTTEGESRIKEYIASREKVLEYINSKIADEKSQMTKYSQAIYNLELAIPEGHSILKLHEENLVALKGIQERMSYKPNFSSWRLKSESTSKSHCKEMETRLTESRDVSLVDEQLEITQKEARALWDDLSILERELEGWKFLQGLSIATLERLNTSKELEEKGLLTAKAAFSPVRRVSIDVWSEVFKIVLQAEFDDYIKQNDTKTLRPMVYVLSHVCRYWRSTVFSEPSLWSLVYAAPVTAWRQDEIDLLTTSVTKSTKPIIIFTNLWQAFTQGYNYGQRYEKSGNWVTGITPTEEIFKGKDYALHVNIRNDDSSYMQRSSYLPFKRATSITFSAITPLCYGYLFSYGSFSMVRSLTIINEEPQALPNIDMTSTFPQLTTLSFRVNKIFPTFSLGQYLATTLEELHIQQMVAETFPQLTQGTLLPKLRTLGITPAALALLSNLAIPELRKLVLYGSNDPSEQVSIAGVTSMHQVLRRLHHLDFRTWGEIAEGNLNVGAISLLEGIILKTAALQTITFTDSWINGGELANIMEDSMSESNAEKIKYLKEVTLAGVYGITRNECDRIVAVVPKLNIYV